MIAPSETDIFLMDLVAKRTPFWKMYFLCLKRKYVKKFNTSIQALKDRCWRFRMFFWQTNEEKTALHVCSFKCVTVQNMMGGMTYCHRGGVANFIRISPFSVNTKEVRLAKMRLLHTEATADGPVEVPVLLASHLFMSPNLYSICVDALVRRQVSDNEIVFGWHQLVEEVRNSA